MSYRDDVDALDARVGALRGELNQAEQLAAEARKLVRNSVLEAEIATPCLANWADMVGSDSVRHCNRCNKNVYNFAELTRDEIDVLIVRHDRKLCTRMFRRADGTVITKDCKRDIRVGPSRLAGVLGASAIAAGVLGAAASIALKIGDRKVRTSLAAEARASALEIQLTSKLSDEISDDAPDEDSNGYQAAAFTGESSFHGQ